jgi:hypothetical protein
LHKIETAAPTQASLEAPVNKGKGLWKASVLPLSPIWKEK